ncbi:ABC transporter permease [Spirosoma utsteinense]|uniref:Lipoprotein-releasing system permease protein n=1 Tax=Spirosoma utsteinense TaxID=2585773 RepID=A0ABR6W741_9BACT|nr:ABC transporter permease [Spirosoma utsteinense]MBC3785862.1 lipoprotein-releasing system permease protein [Spirosoma utsteinense]MBC3792034.1 lipoprotein-releasing system permease protein [Spirosoma utsteinense]
MNLPAWIARRYFFSKKKRSFISWLSILSMLGVGVGTMALVIVLSVFNGMEDLNRQIFKTFESDITITPKEGKRFMASPQLLARLRQTPGVLLLTAVAQDNALAKYANGQTVVRLKGVDDNYLQRQQLDSALIEGKLLLRRDGINFAVVADGVRSDLSISLIDILTPLEILYPRSGQSFSVLNPDAFSSESLTVAGVFFIESRYDNFVLAPLATARALFGYQPNEVTSLELQLRPGTDEGQARQALQEVVDKATTAADRPGTALIVQSRDDLNVDLYRAIRVEKLFVALTLGFIILIASINIFFSLSMLVIEKKEDIKILFAMGATAGLVRRIFLTEGAIIALTGAVTGLVLGVVICLAQEEYGFIRMGMVSSIVDAYPVRVYGSDILLTGVLVIVVTIVTSWFPAQRAARVASVSNS